MPKKPRIASAAELVTPPILFQGDALAHGQHLHTYFESLRVNPMVLAEAEAARLRDSGYLKFMARQFVQDLDIEPLPNPSAAGRGLKLAADSIARQQKRKARHGRMKFSRRQLRLLFQAVAARTTNVILSQVLIAPVTVMDRPGDFMPARIYAKPARYRGASFALGFVQVQQIKSRGDFSVSVPFFGFDRDYMADIAFLQPEKMFEAFRTVMTAGNHDMQHHLTNTTLNAAIADTSGRATLAPRRGVSTWSSDHFGDIIRDEDVRSYESWLILSHARIQSSVMAESDVVACAVDTFLTELSRITAHLRAEMHDIDASVVSDYFGTMLGFVMMRFLPFNHPLFQQTLARLEKIDPLAGQSQQAAESSTAFVDLQLQYLDAGQPLKVNQYGIKKINDIVQLAPEIALLNVPEGASGPVAEAKLRVGKVYTAMLEAAAQTAWFMPDGYHVIDMGAQTIMELHCRDGQPFREGDLPAATKTDLDLGRREQQWYIDGLPGRAGGLPATVLSFTEENEFRTYLHREEYRSVEYPIDPQQANVVEINTDGQRAHRWFDRGTFVRQVVVDAANNLIDDTHPSSGAYTLTRPLQHPPVEMESLKQQAVPTARQHGRDPVDIEKLYAATARLAALANKA